MAPLAREPDRAPAGRSLCEHLRSDHGARHDWPEDLAARIIDLVAVLEAIERRGKNWFNAEVPGEVGVHPSLERVRTRFWYTAGVAVDLGTVHALFHIYRQKDDVYQKPRQTKREIWEEFARSLGDVSSKKEARNAIAEGKGRIAALGDRWHVYLDGDDLCAVNSRTRHPKQIKLTYFLKKYLKLR